MMLAAGLLASVAVVSSSSATSALRARATVAAEATARRALARALLGWNAESAALAVGGFRERDLVPLAGDASADLPVQIRLRIQRLSPVLYQLAADARVAAANGGARRRIALLVQCAVAADSAVCAGPPQRITQWSATDLY